MPSFLDLNNPPWAELKELALDCGFSDDGYGDPVCDWDAVWRLAHRVALMTAEDAKREGRE